MDPSKLTCRLQPSNSCRTLALVVCHIACACGGETRERPLARSAAADVRPSELPLPPNGFTDDDTRVPDERPDRFATRRIGEESERVRFHGAAVDVDLKAADLHDVFRLLADVGKVNIVVAGEVSGTVTMRLRRVPWDQAMDVIARAHGLAYEREGNVILVRSAK